MILSAEHHDDVESLCYRAFQLEPNRIREWTETYRQGEFDDLQETNAIQVGIDSASTLFARLLTLGADLPRVLSPENRHGFTVPGVPDGYLTWIRRLICSGLDPLGDVYCSIRSSTERREQGATYTPDTIVRFMVDWAANYGDPRRVVDPGTGSGRYLMEAARRFPKSELVGIECDPIAANIARANLAAAGFEHRCRIIVADYVRATLPEIEGRTLYIGNPPYVRHHLLGSRLKDWFAAETKRRGLEASRLAGLHVYFFLATVMKARSGDYGAFVTSAEWLDVNYGGFLRDLVLGQLGGQGIIVIEPTARPFPDAASTAAITTFEIASKRTTLDFRRVRSLRELGGPGLSHKIPRQRFETERRWSNLSRARVEAPSGYVELGEICRVHRGQVTGANRVWVEGSHTCELPSSVLFPSVTKARELFEAHGIIDDLFGLRRVIDLPVDISAFEGSERETIDRFLRWARSQGAHRGYVARTRQAWWSVGLREPAAIIASYMARRPPAFVYNAVNARHINIAHGLYPREHLSKVALTTLVSYLRINTKPSDGRTYSGGLTKFEPREMERILVPGPDMLERGVTNA